MKKHFFFMLLLGSAGLLFSCSTNKKITWDKSSVPQAPFFYEQVLFSAGMEGYDTFRIPALITSRQGTLLAFCEGRKNSRSDTGNIDLVMRRSVDGGATWGPLHVLWDDQANTCGNPAPVADRDTGTIWLLMTHNDGNTHEREINQGKGSRGIWIMSSQDDGLTWSAPQEITRSVKKPDWRWYATGPGHGIQLRNGRLMIACDHSLGPDFKDWHSHVIFSDDHGKTWKMGGSEPAGFTNESMVVELNDGSLYLNMRNYKEGNRRQISYSHNGGKSWTKGIPDNQLIEPRCQASAIRFTSNPAFQKNRILFSNPASTQRNQMTVRISYDETRTWAVEKRIHEGPSAYSDLAVLPDGIIALLYEKGEKHPYETITLARMNVEWLTGGKDFLVCRK